MQVTTKTLTNFFEARKELLFQIQFAKKAKISRDTLTRLLKGSNIMPFQDKLITTMAYYEKMDTTKVVKKYLALKKKLDKQELKTAAIKAKVKAVSDQLKQYDSNGITKQKKKIALD